MWLLVKFAWPSHLDVRSKLKHIRILFPSDSCNVVFYLAAVLYIGIFAFRKRIRGKKKAGRLLFGESLARPFRFPLFSLSAQT